MMQDFNDFLKHLRSVHLVLVLASVAVLMALSSSNSTYKTAAGQLHDVIHLSEALTAENIADSISKTAGGSKAKPKLKNFIIDSLDEYFEAMEVYFDSFEIIDFIENLSKEDELLAFEIDEFREEDETDWFWFHRCLLGDGTNVYVHPADLFIENQLTTLGHYTSLLSRLVSADRLYISPNFYPGYLGDGPVYERYKLAGIIKERLGEMKDIRLSITLTEVKFTDSTSRKIFKTSQEHVNEDPSGYYKHDFKFDTLTLEIKAFLKGDTDKKSLKFSLELPVMFSLRQPQFVAETLRQAPFDNAYYSRYISGARSFEQLFPELADIATNLISVTPKDLERYLLEQMRASGAPINLLGLQIGRDLIEVWGVLFMLCVQLYFCMHYYTLLQRLPRNNEILFPWIGLYRDLISAIAFQISLALPFLVCLIVIISPIRQSGIYLLKIGWLLPALGLLGWTEVLYIRYRKMYSKVKKGSAVSIDSK